MTSVVLSEAKDLAAEREITLALDASTYTGTVAVLRGGDLLATREVAMRGADEERLMPAVAATLDDAGFSVAALSRIVCGEGPGSFTSLRIAGSIAKGIAFTRGIPLLTVSSLALIVAGTEPTLAPGRWVAVLDALRQEAYVAECEVGGDGEVTSVAAMRIVPNAELATLEASGARLIGPVHGVSIPHARGVQRLQGWLATRAPTDLGTWEPAYGRVAEAQARWEAAHGRPLSRA